MESSERAQKLLGHSTVTTTEGYIRGRRGDRVMPLERGITDKKRRITEIKTLLADLLGLEAIRVLGAKALETAKLLKAGLAESLPAKPCGLPARHLYSYPIRWGEL